MEPLSLDKCRKIDPGFEFMSDKELDQINYQLHQLAELALDYWLKQKGSKNATDGYRQNKIEELKLEEYE